MTVHYEDESVRLIHGDCLDVLRSLPDNSVDSVVTDPPYDLTAGKKGGTGPASVTLDNPYGRARITAGFMGKAWDGTGIAFKPELWVEALRVLKPGGHLLAFGGSRTWHRLACAVEDAGFEVRDSIAWLYGSGFPKSLDVSKAIDKAAGATREVVGTKTGRGARPRNDMRGGQYGSAPVELIDTSAVTAPATEEAARFAGWGTALKPAFEPVVVARKPLAAGTVAANVLAHGTGALNVDGCRVGTTGEVREQVRPTGGNRTSMGQMGTHTPFHYEPGSGGRWPTNVVLSSDAAEELDAEVGTLKSGANPTRRSSDKFRDAYGEFRGQEECTPARGADEGGPSRFFPTFRYAAKAPTRERPSYVPEGADGSVAGSPATSGRRCNVCGNQTVPKGGKPWPACGHDDWTRFETENRTAGKVAHPTVKPLALMEWLVRLVTPPGGTVLEPFAGSGTTVEACLLEGFRCIAIEREADYLPLIEARIARQQKPDVPTASEALALFDFEEPA